jgi:hypothetical protein
MSASAAFITTQFKPQTADTPASATAGTRLARYVALSVTEDPMAKLAVLAALALSLLAACSTYQPAYTTTPPDARPAVAYQVPATTYRPGYGMIEAIAIERYAPSAAAGGTVGPVGHPIDRTGYRLTVRMDDGTLQSIAQDNRDFRVGDRVQLTRDGRVVGM